MANNNDDLKKWRWRLAIMAADTWVDPSARGSKKKTGNLKPLAALFASGAPVPPKIYGLLADLLSRHRLKSTTQRTFAVKIYTAPSPRPKWITQRKCCKRAPRP